MDGCQWTHRKHPFVDREFINDGKRGVSTKNLDVAVKLLENRMPTSLVIEWLVMVTRRKPSVDMINSLRQSVVTEKNMAKAVTILRPKDSSTT